MEEEFTITKNTVECYKVRKQTDLWADITIDPGVSSGRIQIASSHGSWENYWGACGMSFKEFLISLNMEYSAGKFGASRVFDHESTIAYLRERVNNYYENHEHADVVAEELKALEDAYSREHFVVTMNNCPLILEMEDQMPDLHERTDPRFIRFWNCLWIPFTTQLKKEL